MNDARRVHGRELSALNKFSLNVIRIGNEEELFWHVAKNVVGQMGFDDCVIYRVDENGKTLNQVAAIGAKNPRDRKIENALVISIGNGITGSVADTGKPRIVSDLSVEPDYIPDLDPARSEICVPIMCQGAIAGVIDCEDPEENKFNTFHLDVLTTVAAMVGAKLETMQKTALVEDQNRTLKANEVRLREALRVAKLGSWDVDGTGHLFWSPEVFEMFDVYPEDFDGTSASFYRVVHPGDREMVREKTEYAWDNLERYECVHRVVKRCGEVITVRESADVVKGPNGQTVRLIGTVQDITEQTRADELLRRAQRLKAIGQLTGGVAHDFNNLLAVIQAGAEFLKITPDHDAAMVQSILDATKRGADLTHRLLAYARQQSLSPKSLDLVELVGGMRDLLERTLGATIDISVTTSPGLWNVRADPSQLQDAILNLALNARDVMPNGGSLTIACSNTRHEKTQPNTGVGAETGEYVEIAVTDTGMGMSEEVKSNAFEPFYTTKDVGEGSGLGLSMILGFAEQTGGSADIESKVGIGTTVRLLLPKDSRRSDVRTDREEQTPMGKGEIVLLIEDDPNVRKLTSRSLENLGYGVLEAEHAASVRVLLDELPHFDVVLSDVVLPGSTSGPELAQEIKAYNPSVKFVFMSGYPADSAQSFAECGPEFTLLSKPFPRSKLAKTLRDVLDQDRT